MTAKRSKTQKAMRRVRHQPRCRPALLRRLCDPKTVFIQSTDELPDLQDVIGNRLAIRAWSWESELSVQGYNTFVLDYPVPVVTTLTRDIFNRQAEHKPTPDEWCYVSGLPTIRAARKALRLPRVDAEVFCRGCANPGQALSGGD